MGNDKTAGERSVLESVQCPVYQIADGLFGRRVDSQAYHTWRSCRRKPQNVGEVGIEGNENSVALDCKRSDLFVRFSRETGFDDGDSVVTLLSEDGCMFR